MMTQKRQKYDRGFKRKAVELSFVRGNAKEIAEELGIRPELLYRWRREYQSHHMAFHEQQLSLLLHIACSRYCRSKREAMFTPSPSTSSPANTISPS